MEHTKSEKPTQKAKEISLMILRFLCFFFRIFMFSAPSEFTAIGQGAGAPDDFSKPNGRRGPWKNDAQLTLDIGAIGLHNAPR
jgi:hypothetical protein